MHAVRFVVVIALCSIAATIARAAGFQLIEVPADADGPALTGAMWYPCGAPPAAIEVGSSTIFGSKDCPVSGARLPLVVFSHGSRGSFLVHRDTAETLADAGFVVAAINHPGNNARDRSRTGDLGGFVERPCDIKRLIDFMLGNSVAAGHIDQDRIGFFGFSRGGYTGLVLAGANPDWAAATSLCLVSSWRICKQMRDKAFPTGRIAHDPRIKAEVIADPFSYFFTAQSLASVRLPIQLWSSERGGDGITPESVAALDKAMLVPHESHVVTNSSHFAFLTPCEPALAARLPEICTDAAGFDRIAFHKKFDANVLAFFRAYL
jgi:predicted dienelactone hydrolase